MSTVTKTPRLLAAAKEFNIGKETLIEYLTAKGFEVNASNPNTKLTEQMYDSLQAEFAQDKAAKRKSNEIALPKGTLEGMKKPKEEAEPLPKEKKEEVKPEPPVKKEEKPKVETPAPKAEVIPPAVVAEIPEPIKPTKAPKAVDESISAPEATTAEHIDVKAPKLGGPNILGKINLDEINSSGKPKKSVAKKSDTKEETPKEDTAAAKPKKTTKKADVEVPPHAAPLAPIPPAVPEEDDKPEHIEMKAPKLEGPKIIGRIDLPVEQPNNNNSKEKRNRKRIPVQKKPETFNPNQPNQQGTGERRGGPGGGQQGRGPGGPGQNRNNTGGGGDRRGGGFGQGGGDRRGPRQDRNAPVSAQQQEIDAKAIQEKIRQTQAKLTGGGARGKNLKSKYRRNKREEMAEKRAAEEESQQTNLLQVTEFISVSELASLLNVSFADVISKCMGLGIMVSINQRLDAEVIELVAGEFNYDVEFINLEQEADIEEDEADDPADLLPRAPIVTIMGHVDHGKTSLLDYIREANVVAGEAGGITQHIGAYQVTTKDGKKITFLDTPGHEAFTAMRARGAKVADVAVIVVAADDAIMPQTKEAISHAQAANLPMIFAINKIDKDGANPEKIKEQLSQMNILVEDWGGKFQSQEISAKKGINIELLLEKILLESELLEVKANPDRYATGSVIEASLDKGRGYQSTILVQNGTLEQGDMIVCGQHYGKIKAMFNERGQRVDKAGPSAPVQILGLNGAPQAGEKFKVYEDENEAKEIATHRAQIMREQGIRARKHITLDEIGRRLALGNFKELALIIKGDFDGSVEALSDSLQKLSTEEVAVNIVHKGVGQITESDVLLATASDAIILGFQVRPSLQTSKLAEQENIEIRYYSIIYDAIDEIKSAMEGLLEPKIEKKAVCNIEVREVYKIGGIGTIAGSYVLDGKMTRNTKLNIVRDGIVVHTGELSSLKRFKDDVKEVNAGYECGLMIKNYNDIRVGDIIEGFEEVEVKRTL
jgi:translation initiation factor IF-2